MKKNPKVVSMWLVSILIILAVAMIVVDTLDEPEKINAKPGIAGVDEVITIDKGQSYEFDVPFDATSKIEALPPSFDSYVQSKNRLLYATKLNINGYSTIYNDSGAEIYNLPNDRYAVFYSSKDRNITGTSYVSVLNLNGDVLKKYSTNNSILQTELPLPIVTNKQYQQYTYGSLQINENVFTQGYGRAINIGTTPTEYGANFIEIADDNDATITVRELTTLGLSGNDYQMTSILGESYDDHRFSTGNSLLNMTTITDPTNLSQKVVKKSYTIAQPTLTQLGLAGKGWEAWKYADRYAPTILQEFHDGSLLVRSLLVNTSTTQPNILVTYLLDNKGKFKPNSSIYTWRTGTGSGFMEPLKLISDKTKTRVIVSNRPTNTNDKNTLIYEFSNGQVGPPKLIKEYSYNTDMIIDKFTDPVVPSVKYVAAGNISELTPEFISKGMTEPGAFVAYMDEEFNIESVGSISDKNDGSLTFSDMAINGGKIGIVGTSYSNTSFVTDQSKVFPQGKYVTKQSALFTADAYFGGLDTYYDYSPLITAPNYIMVDIDDPEIKSGNQKVTSNWLISGEKNGTFDLNTAVKVHDSFDLDQTLGKKNQAWLNERININPLDANYLNEEVPTIPIDWASLGFNKNKRGPQKVTYFITDTKSQTTSTSRNVNKTDEHTEVTSKAAIGANNVTIHIDDVMDFWYDQSTSRESAAFSVAKMSNLTAWLLTGEDESETSKVEIDLTELKNINETEVAKPFPLTFIYKYANGKEVVKKITVFVIDDKTGVANEMVLYGQDYRLKIPSESATEVKEKVVNHSDVVVYNSKKNSQNTGIPELIADKNSPLLQYEIDKVDLKAINDAEFPQVLKQKITYTNSQGKSVSGRVDVTLYIDIAINIRQVVLEDNKGLVIPSEGFIKVKYDYLLSQGTLGDNEINGNVVSTVDLANQIFTRIKVEGFKGFNYNKNKLNVIYTIPEYYKFSGHIQTSSLKKHEVNSVDYITAESAREIKIDFSEKSNEYWLSIYVKPVKQGTQTILPYSWGYQVNTYGEIKID